MSTAHTNHLRTGVSAVHHTAAALLVVMSAAYALPVQNLSPMTYRFVSYAVTDPKKSAAFLARYTGAERILKREDFLTSYRPSAMVEGVRLYYRNRTLFSDVYFVKENKPSGNLSVHAFNKILEKTHSMAPDDWDWWQDWHICFTVSDLDAVATKLFKEKVPFVNRGGLYFQIPGGLTIQVLGKASIYWSETFLFCRETNELTASMKPYPTNVTDIDMLLDKPLPEFVPSHQSYVSSNAVEAAAWASKYLSTSRIDPKSYYISHQYANGTCAMIQWLEIATDGWEFHFIEQYRKRQGELKIARFESFVKDLHSRSQKSEGFDDAYDSFRTGFSVPSLVGFMDMLSHDAEQVYHYDSQTRRLTLMAPNGFLIELNEDHSV